MEKEEIQIESDRRLFYLKTLHDIGNELFSIVDIHTILHNFLLMIMGNFGVMKGFVLLFNHDTGEISNIKDIGLDDSEKAFIKENVNICMQKDPLPKDPFRLVVRRMEQNKLTGDLSCAFNFRITDSFSGGIGLGSKINGEPYSVEDDELLLTLINNLTVSLKNAMSFEDIKRLNLDLQDKNIKLENALSELKMALRKVEILESIKSNLSKFVPATVCRLIEKSPTSSIPENREQDVSVLFLDIQGYTAMSEKLGYSELSHLVEEYFSVFMDAIYKNKGDVNETAGDGLMVLYLDEDETANALNAVRTATAIKREAELINKKGKSYSDPLFINMGINSGRALVGTAKFDSYTGSRWTYTARGMVTNVAARIAGRASGGEILLSETTANRINSYYPVTFQGQFSLKNVSEKVPLFSVSAA